MIDLWTQYNLDEWPFSYNIRSIWKLILPVKKFILADQKHAQTPFLYKYIFICVHGFLRVDKTKYGLDYKKNNETCNLRPKIIIVFITCFRFQHSSSSQSFRYEYIGLWGLLFSTDVRWKFLVLLQRIQSTLYS